MAMHRYGYIFAFSLMASGLVSSVVGQEPDTVGSLPGIEVKTSVDQVESYIGDLITYTLTIVYDPSYELIPPPLGANLGAFEVKDYQPDIETELADGRLESRTIFVLSTYTTGDYIIPPLPVGFTLPDSSRKVIMAEPIPIQILSLLDMAGSDSVDIRPLKPPLEAEVVYPPDYSDYYIWGGAGLAVLIVAGTLIGWWWWRRRGSRVEDLRPPWEIAFEKLAFVKVEYLDKGFPEQVRAKDYYFELTEVGRAYLGRIYRADVLEMTTEEFLDVFREIDLPDELHAKLQDFLDHADRVKFARMMPETRRAEDDFLFVHGLVDSVRMDYERRQEMVVQAAGQGDALTSVAEESHV